MTETAINPLSPVERIKHPLFDEFGVNVFIKRDDLIHPIISGNKWRKLKYNIEQVSAISGKGVLSFGGAYSNHIHALAYYCFLKNIPCIGIIRGEEHYANNYTLSWARQWGMKLHFVDRQTYRRRQDTDYLQALSEQFPDYFIVPEGGSNNLALRGIADVVKELKQQCQFDSLVTPVGSGGTIAGLVAADNNMHNILGICVLKGAVYLKKDVNRLLGDQAEHCTRWQILHQFHCGGYAKFSENDLATMLSFSEQTTIPIEPVYSGKMMLALLSLIKQGYFAKGQRIMLLHTGGLQGLGGLAEQSRIRADQWPSLPTPQVP